MPSIRDALLCCLLAATLSGAVRAAESIAVYAVNYPLYYFAQRIAGEQARVTFPAPPDRDPASWMPSVAEIAAYQQADLILLNGAGYASWTAQAALPRSRSVNTSQSFAARYIALEDAVRHSHGPRGAHSHAGTAWTTWLDFAQAALQARAISDALVRRRPDAAGTFERNYLALSQELMSMDRRVEGVVSGHRDRPLMASHPVYQYLARRHGLNVQSVQWEPDAMPNDAQWAALDELLKQHPARWMLWESEPHGRVAAMLNERGVGSLVFDPCANRPARGDFMAVMRHNIENLERGFEPR